MTEETTEQAPVEESQETIQTLAQDGPPPSTEARKAAKEAAAPEDKPDESTEEATDDQSTTEEDQEDEDAPKDEPLDTSVWGDSGNEVANSVLTTLQNSGVKPEEAKALLWDAVEKGDPKLVDRAALVDKVGETSAVLIMSGIENVTRTNNDKIAEVQATVNTAAGSAENWKVAAEWAKANLAPDDLEEARAMLDAGGKKAQFAAADIITQYNADPKNTSLGVTKPLVGEGRPTKKVEGITRTEYGTQLLKLQRTKASAAEFAALRAKRQAGQKQGI